MFMRKFLQRQREVYYFQNLHKFIGRPIPGEKLHSSSHAGKGRIIEIIQTPFELLFLAVMLYEGNNFSSSELFARSAYNQSHSIFGERHSLTLECQRCLSGTLALVGKYEEALSMQKEICKVQQSKNEFTQLYVSDLRNIAILYMKLKKDEEASDYARLALKLSQEKFGENHEETRKLNDFIKTIENRASLI